MFTGCAYVRFLFICLSVYLFICLSVYLFIWFLFWPILQVRIVHLVDHYITYVSSRRWACGCDPTIAVKVASLGYPLEHQAIWLYPKVAPSSVMGLAEGADSYLLPKGFHGAAQ